MAKTMRTILAALAILSLPAQAQTPGDPTQPDGPRLDGAALFRNQCGVCHVLDATAAARQGPHLAGIVGRKPGSVPGYRYSAGYQSADFVWDPAHLDTYLTNPQAMIPGSNMAYKQAKPEVRAAIIAYLESQH